MGGEGSGRKPDVMKMAKEQFQNNSVEFEEVPLILPNYSGVQKAALKTGTNMTAGSVLFAGADGQIAQDNTNLFWDDSNNRLGIGTTSPDEHLEVEGTGTQRIQVVKTDATVGSSKLSVSSTGGFVGSKDNILFQIGTNDAGVISINGSNVGIGTTTPKKKLEWNDDVGFSVDGKSLMWNTYFSSGFKAVTTGDYAAYIALNTDGSMSFHTSALTGTADAAITIAEQMRIDKNGNVGIGTTGPATALHLVGGAFTIENTSAPSTPSGAGACFVSGGELWYIGSSGTQTRLAVA